MRALFYSSLFVFFSLLGVSSAACADTGLTNKERTLIDAIVDTSLCSPRSFSRSLFYKMPLYVIDVELSDDLRSYTGRQEVAYTNNSDKNLSFVVFQVPANYFYNLIGHRPNLRFARISGENVSGYEFVDGTQGVLKIRLKEPAAPAQVLRFSFEFTSQLPELNISNNLIADSLSQLSNMLNGGSDRGKNYGIYGFSSRNASYAHWYPIVAKLTKDGFDEVPGTGLGDIANFDAANYLVNISCASNPTVVTSGVKSQSSAHSSTHVGAALREFSLVANHRLQHTSQTVNGVVINSYALPEHQQRGRNVLKYAANAIKFFSAAFGPYPYKEFDVVEAPLANGAGGMEFSGMVTIAQAFYADLNFAADSEVGALIAVLGNQASSDVMGRYLEDMVEYVTAHEAAHQWWHGMVGSDSKRYPFIDESLTNYSSVLYSEAVHGQRRGEKDTFMQLEVPYQMLRMSNGSDREASLGTDEYSSGVEYSAIVYGKGALFYRALRKQLGDKVFITALRNYFKRNQFGYSTPETLKRSLTRTVAAEYNSNESSKTAALMNRWIYETHGDEDLGKPDPQKLMTAFLGEDMANSLASFTGQLFQGQQVQLGSSYVSNGDVPEGTDLKPIIALLGQMLKQQSNLNGGNSNLNPDPVKFLLRELSRELNDLS